MIRIAIAQLNPVVGAFEANAEKIKKAYLRACEKQARLLLTTELVICGYPPYDLLERAEIYKNTQRVLDSLAQMTQGQKCALAVGHVAYSSESIGKPAQNVVSVLENGSCIFRQAKTLLPTYDVFDEARYFEPSQSTRLWNCDGIQIAFAICEDLWGDNPYFRQKIYAKDPILSYQEQGADLICALSASPYFIGKSQKREQVHRMIAKRLKVPLIYVNQVGATDEVLFDGGSFVLDPQGIRIHQLPVFQESFGIVAMDASSKIQFQRDEEVKDKKFLQDSQDETEILARGLVTGIQEYFKKTHFTKAIVGLSGGIDSAVVAVLAVRALGEKNVLGIAMPSQYSSSHSLEDAEILAKNLNISFEVRPIKFLFSTALRELSEGRGQLAPLAAENLQARLRGVILMCLSNHENALVLTTGNKSELAMGYCTLYGDMAGALAPIGDLFKTRVYQLAQFMNESWGGLIPERTLKKAPSAELRPNQTDQDTLPPYELLDKLLEEYIENGTSVDEISLKFDSQPLGKIGNVREIIRRVEINEYKRKQAAPILKVTQKAFGIGRRVPIAKSWEF